jgi:hypothetical protein
VRNVRGQDRKNLLVPTKAFRCPLLAPDEEARGMPVVLGIVVPSLVAVMYFKRHNSDPEHLRDRVVMFSGERRISESL